MRERIILLREADKGNNVAGITPPDQSEFLGHVREIIHTISGAAESTKISDPAKSARLKEVLWQIGKIPQKSNE